MCASVRVECTHLFHDCYLLQFGTMIKEDVAIVLCSLSFALKSVYLLHKVA